MVGGSPVGSALSLNYDLNNIGTGRSIFFRGGGSLGWMTSGSSNEVRLADVVVIRVPQRRDGVGVSIRDADEENDRGVTAHEENQDTFMLNFISSSTRNQTVNRNWFG